MTFLSGNLKYLRKKYNKTQDKLSADINIGRTTIANYESGLSEPNLETIIILAKYFDVAVDDILSINLEEQQSVRSNSAQLKTGIQQSKQIYDRKVPLVVTVDNSGKDNILFVPVKARAGYLLGYGDPEFIETLPTFRLPGLSNSTFRMFEVEGPSMAPNILHGDYIIGEWVDSLEDVRDNRVYVVVHKGGVAVKRVLKEQGKFYLKSDTIAHRQEYPTIEVAPEDITEIWYGRLKISSDFSEPTEVSHRLTSLEADMEALKRQVLK